MLVFVTGRDELVDRLPGGRIAFVALFLGALVVLLLPMSGPLMRTVSSAVAARRGGTSEPLAPLSPVVLAGSACANTVAWLAYGSAVLLLARGLMPSLAPALDYGRVLGGFTAAYVAGVLAVLAPGGLGVREGLLVLLFAPALGEGGALVLALAARVLFTVAELGAAAPFAFFRKESLRVQS